MLPRSSRLHRSVDFTAVVRGGVRAARPTLVLHARRGPAGRPVRVGLIVSKAVGNAVTRNTVKRRIRHLAAARLSSTPAGVDVVVRALPAAATSSEDLARDLPSAWSRALSRLPRQEM